MTLFSPNSSAQTPLLVYSRVTQRNLHSTIRSCRKLDCVLQNTHTQTALIKCRRISGQYFNKSSEHNVTNSCQQLYLKQQCIIMWSMASLYCFDTLQPDDFTNPKCLTEWCHLRWCNLLLLKLFWLRYHSLRGGGETLTWAELSFCLSLSDTPADTWLTVWEVEEPF